MISCVPLDRQRIVHRRCTGVCWNIKNIDKKDVQESKDENGQGKKTWENEKE